MAVAADHHQANCNPGYLTHNLKYIIRNTQYFTVLAKRLRYSGQKYVDLKIFIFQIVQYHNSILGTLVVSRRKFSNGHDLASGQASDVRSEPAFAELSMQLFKFAATLGAAARFLIQQFIPYTIVGRRLVARGEICYLINHVRVL